MSYSAIVDDKMLANNEIGVKCEDDSFWNQFTNIHAIQVDVNNSSWVELKDGTSRDATEEEKTKVINKFNEVNNAIIEADEQKKSAWNNSWDKVRRTRNIILKETDKYLVADFPITNEKRTEWETYRTDLRNIPITYADEEPVNITFDLPGNVYVSGTKVISVPN